MVDVPRPRNADERAQQALNAVKELREDMESFKGEIRRDNYAMNEMMGKMMKLVIHADNSAVDTKAIVERLERKLSGEGPRPAAPSHHDVEEIIKRTVDETVKTDRHIIPPMSMPSERVRETIKNERNELVVGALAKVAIALLVAFALLGAGMAIRDCQHGTVPTQLH